MEMIKITLIENGVHPYGSVGNPFRYAFFNACIVTPNCIFPQKPLRTRAIQNLARQTEPGPKMCVFAELVIYEIYGIIRYHVTYGAHHLREHVYAPSKRDQGNG